MSLSRSDHCRSSLTFKNGALAVSVKELSAENEHLRSNVSRLQADALAAAPLGLAPQSDGDDGEVSFAARTLNAADCSSADRGCAATDGAERVPFGKAARAVE